MVDAGGYRSLFTHPPKLEVVCFVAAQKLATNSTPKALAWHACITNAGRLLVKDAQLPKREAVLSGTTAAGDSRLCLK